VQHVGTLSELREKLLGLVESCARGCKLDRERQTIERTYELANRGVVASSEVAPDGAGAFDEQRSCRIVVERAEIEYDLAFCAQT
jgi:hypothetical protein